MWLKCVALALPQANFHFVLSKLKVNETFGLSTGQEMCLFYIVSI